MTVYELIQELMQYSPNSDVRVDIMKEDERIEIESVSKEWCDEEWCDETEIRIICKGVEE